MNHFEFHRNNYLIELQRKHDLDSSIAVPVGIVSVIGGVIFIFVKDLKGFNSDITFLFLALFLTVSVLSLILGIVYLILSYYHYDYMYVPTSSELKKYYDDLLKHYDNETDQAETEFKEYVSGEYAANAHINSINNNSKSAYMHKAKGFVILALASLLITCPFYLVKYYSLEQAQKVEIISFEKHLKQLEVIMNSNKDDQPKTPPPKPTPPKSKSLRESQQPAKTPPPSKEE